MKFIYLILLTVLSLAANDLFAQDCAPEGKGNPSGKRFILTYNNVVERNTALAAMTSITIDGVSYVVQAHPSSSTKIRTTPAQADDFFDSNFTGDVTQNPSGDVCHYESGVLPITLSYIYATLDNSDVIIKWRTEQEINNEGFEIQKSFDGTTFEPISWIDGAGDSNFPLSYQYTDGNLSLGENYYRFKQMDFDGRYEYSPIVVIIVNDIESVHLQSNVINIGQNLELVNALDQEYTIYNTTGMKVLTSRVFDNRYKVQTNNLKAGMYYIAVENKAVIKFIIQ